MQLHEERHAARVPGSQCSGARDGSPHHSSLRLPVCTNTSTLHLVDSATDLHPTLQRVCQSIQWECANVGERQINNEDMHPAWLAADIFLMRFACGVLLHSICLPVQAPLLSAGVQGKNVE